VAGKDNNVRIANKKIAEMLQNKKKRNNFIFLLNFNVNKIRALKQYKSIIVKDKRKMRKYVRYLASILTNN
jgi:hypothetical protein